MGISITTTPARIAFERIPGSFEMKVKNAQLELQQNHAKINISTEQPRILIDQYQCFAEEGLKNNFDFAKEQAQNGYQSAMDYIAKKAQDGDAMAKIGRKANIMIDIIARDSVTTHEFGMVTMPMSRPQIDVEGGTVTIEVEPQNGIGKINGVTGRFIEGEVSYSFTPAQINFQTLAYASVNISYSGNNVDRFI